MPRMPMRNRPVGQERVNENQQMRRRLESELRETCDLVTLKWCGMVTQHVFNIIIYIYKYIMGMSENVGYIPNEIAI